MTQVEIRNSLMELIWQGPMPEVPRAGEIVSMRGDAGYGTVSHTMWYRTRVLEWVYKVYLK